MAPWQAKLKVENGSLVPTASVGGDCFSLGWLEKMNFYLLFVVKASYFLVFSCFFSGGLLGAYIANWWFLSRRLPDLLEAETTSNKQPESRMRTHWLMCSFPLMDR